MQIRDLGVSIQVPSVPPIALISTLYYSLTVFYQLLLICFILRIRDAETFLIKMQVMACKDFQVQDEIFIFNPDPKALQKCIIFYKLFKLFTPILKAYHFPCGLENKRKCYVAYKKSYSNAYKVYQYGQILNASSCSYLYILVFHQLKYDSCLIFFSIF